MELSQKLEQYMSGGVVESSGGFTIGLQQAREKLLRFQAVSRERYLVVLVSALIRAGAEHVDIQADQSRMELNAPGALVQSREIRDGFIQLLAEKGTASGLDLILALQAIMRNGAVELALVGGCGEHSFLWQLKAEKESFQEREGPCAQGVAVSVVMNKPTFVSRAARLLRGLGGYAAMPPACRMVDSLCEHAPVPITINGQKVNRPGVPMEAPVQGVVGVPPIGYLRSSETVELEGEQEWSGVLALVEGTLEVVVDGVSYSVPGTDLAGIVWESRLDRDLGREKLVRNQAFAEMEQRLQEVETHLVRHLIPGLDSLNRRWHTDLDRRLRRLFREGVLDHQEMERVLQFVQGVEGIGGYEIERLQLLLELCHTYHREGREEEKQWAAGRGHDLCMGLDSAQASPAFLAIFAEFCAYLRDRPNPRNFELEWTRLCVWAHDPELSPLVERRLYPELLRALIATRLHSPLTPEQESTVGRIVMNLSALRLSPESLEGALSLLEQAAKGKGRFRDWAVQTATELLRLSVERHGFRDDRLLSRFLSLRELVGRAPDLSALVTECGLMKSLAFREPSVIARDIAHRWAPLLERALKRHQESKLEESERRQVESGLRQVSTVIRRLG